MTTLLVRTGTIAEQLEQAASPDALEALLVSIQSMLGFRHHYLLFQHGGQAPTILTDLPADDSLNPEAIREAAARRVRPFFWNVEKGAPQTRRSGSSIFIIPLHIQGLASGFHAWFSTDDGFDGDQLASGQYLAGCLFDSLFRLHSDNPDKQPRLSPRQIDCLRLAAKGKSDWVAARILGLKPDTIHKYLEQAKTRYGVSTRTELVVRALYTGELHFHDLL